MAHAYDASQNHGADDDELDTLFKTFDRQFNDLQQKFSDIERNIEQFRSEKSSDEEDLSH